MEHNLAFEEKKEKIYKQLLKAQNYKHDDDVLLWNLLVLIMFM